MQYKKKLEYFLGQENEYSDFNIKIYDRFYINSDISNLFESVDYFETSYNEFLFFWHHSSDYVAVIEHYKALDFDTPRLYYILYYLSNLVNIVYADKETRGFVVRYDEIILSSCAFVNKIFDDIEVKFKARAKAEATINQMLDLNDWQYPDWNKKDFIDNYQKHRVALTSSIRQNEHHAPYEIPCYEIKLDGRLRARFLPKEYFSLRVYDIAIPEAGNEPDLKKRVLIFEKIKSDLNTIAWHAKTTNDIGKKYKEYFDVSEILAHIDIYIENVEAAIRLREIGQKGMESASSQNEANTNIGLDFTPKTFGKDEIFKILRFCASQIEKWQIKNILDGSFDVIPDNGKPYVFSNQFEFLQNLRIELEKNVSLFRESESKFREIEQWTVKKMQDKVFAQPLALKYSVNGPVVDQTQDSGDFEKQLSEISKAENKFWKGLPMNVVVKHFEVMSKKASKAGGSFMTTGQLISFLKKGFLDDTTQPKLHINCAIGEKGFVIKRFYELFDLTTRDYKYPSRKKKFIDLFIDCFDNWEESTIKSLFKPGKAKAEW